MKEEIEKTIKNLLDKLNAECNRDEIVVLSQAVLNLSNARYDASSLYGQSWSGDLRKEKTYEELINEAANKRIDVKSLNEQVAASKLNAVSYAATASDETLDGQCASLLLDIDFSNASIEQTRIKIAEMIDKVSKAEQDLKDVWSDSPTMSDCLFSKDKEQLVMMLLERGCNEQFIVEIVNFIMAC